jgi:hypothetical protein
MKAMSDEIILAHYQRLREKLKIIAIIIWCIQNKCPTFVGQFSNKPEPKVMNTQVTHQKFGKGTVTAFDGRLVTVLFNNAGEKKLLAAMANLMVDGKPFVPKVNARVWVNPSNNKDIRVYFGGDTYAKIDVQDFKAFVEMNGTKGEDVATNYRDIMMSLDVNCLIVMNNGKHINTYTYNSK